MNSLKKLALEELEELNLLVDKLGIGRDPHEIVTLRLYQMADEEFNRLRYVIKNAIDILRNIIKCEEFAETLEKFMIHLEEIEKSRNRLKEAHKTYSI